MGKSDDSGDFRSVRIWLWIVAFMVFSMVIVGGATRLTESGLSITEWQLMVGVVPPLDAGHWQEAFDSYKQIPEYRAYNQGMTLEQFKEIYWWEWSHRLLGRLIGLTFLLPYMTFLVLGRLPSRLAWQLAAVFILIAAQGALGWYMVQSGLHDRVDVSQYRLAAHLVLAAFLLAAVIWIVLGLGKNRCWRMRSGQAGALLILGLIFLQIAAGGFVAGLDAGMGYNTWPKMDGHWLPQGLMIMQPKFLNLFENAMTVQFNHRVIAYVVLLVALVHAWHTFSMSGAILVYALLVQMALGIFTLISHVQIALALSHQAGAMIVLALAVWHLHRKSLERGGAFAPAVV